MIKKTLILTSFPLFFAGCSFKFLETLSSNITYQKRTFSDVPAWNTLSSAHQTAFLKSCQALKYKPAHKYIHQNKQFGTYGAWQNICRKAVKSPQQLQAILEQSLVPYEIIGTGKGLFTGYYQPVLEGSLHQTSTYNVPVYGVPQDLIMVNLGQFDTSLKGKHIIGRVSQQKLVPYYARQDISDTQGSGKPLIWLKNKSNRFFLHVQGSGEVVLPNGKRTFLAYAQNNGKPYTAIGRVLKKQSLVKGDVTMPKIRQWIEGNPQKAQWLFNQNARYIYFQMSNKLPTGAQGVDLTPNVSLAVDKSFIPLGVPVYVSSHVTQTQKPFQSLMMAQDVGSAIKGKVRGDIYFGKGKPAAKLAGAQQASGRMFVFFPR